jgi:hypothetical protein
MTEQELRALVRDAIAKAGVGVPDRTVPPARGVGPADPSSHSSHARFTLPPGASDGRCMIEPGVACNQCGYCKSYGH